MARGGELGAIVTDMMADQHLPVDWHAHRYRHVFPLMFRQHWRDMLKALPPPWACPAEEKFARPQRRLLYEGRRLRRWKSRAQPQDLSAWRTDHQPGALHDQAWRRAADVAAAFAGRRSARLLIGSSSGRRHVLLVPPTRRIYLHTSVSRTRTISSMQDMSIPAAVASSASTSPAPRSWAKHALPESRPRQGRKAVASLHGRSRHCSPRRSATRSGHWSARRLREARASRAPPAASSIAGPWAGTSS